jgi:hypothetical protein
METEHAVPNESGRAHLDINRSDRKRSLGALHDVEHSAGTGAPGREATWRIDLRRTLTALASALQEQLGNALASDGLYSDIERDVPRLSRRVERLRRSYGELLDRLSALQHCVASISGTAGADTADVRARIAAFTTELRRVRGEEADLLYEAYLVDIGVGD